MEFWRHLIRLNCPTLQNILIIIIIIIIIIILGSYIAFSIISLKRFTQYYPRKDS